MSRWAHRPTREVLRLAWPVAISMVSYSLMTLVDTLFVGRLGRDSLAGVGLGGTAAFTVLCFGFGLTRGTKVLVSQAMGAGREEEYGPSLSAGLVAALAVGLVGMLASFGIAELLPLIASGAAGRHAHDYLDVRCLSAPVALVFSALREARYGKGDSRSPMNASVVANLSNIAVNYLFVVVLGWGVRGSAWATVIAQCLELSVLASVQLREGVKLLRPTREHFVALLRVGLPTAIQFTLEVGSFALLAGLIASMGAVQMAAHQIALQVIHMSFLPAFAVGEAGSVLVGNAVGADRDELVPRVYKSAMGVAGAYTLACTFVLVLFAGPIANAFTPDVGVRAVAIRLLWVAAAFQVLDAANIIARCALRGTGDVRVAAVLGVLTSWAMTPPLTFLLGRQLHLGALGGWIGLFFEIALASAVLWWRLVRGNWRIAAARSRIELREREPSGVVRVGKATDVAVAA